MMNKCIEIVEVGPRDGLQSEPGVMATATKVEFINRLIDAGLRRLEVTSFVHPKKVPQMADAEQVLAALHKRPDTWYVGLVLNRKGFDRAVAAGCNEIGMAVVASDTFNRRNQGVGTDESIAAWLEIAAQAHAACPPAGHGVCGIRLSVRGRDAGAAGHRDRRSGWPRGGRTRSPSPIRSASACHRRSPNSSGARARRCPAFDCAAISTTPATPASPTRTPPSKPASMHWMRAPGGIGGCPFAPAATGNIPTEDLVYMLQRSGFATGVDLDKLIATGQWLQETLGRPVPGMLVKAGGFPRPHSRLRERGATDCRLIEPAAHCAATRQAGYFGPCHFFHDSEPKGGACHIVWV